MFGNKLKTLHLISSDWWSPHFETDLELIEESILSGNEVLVVFCAGQFSTCMINPEHSWLGCVRCLGRTKNGLAMVGGKIKSIEILDGFPKDNIYWKQEVIPKTLKQFVQIKDGNLEIGYAVGTYLVDKSRNPFVNPTEDINKTINLMNLTSNCYRWFLKLLEKEKPDYVYAMNGRHLYYRSLFQASLDLKIPVFMHERGGNFDQYSLFENSLPHSLSFWDTMILDCRKKHNVNEIVNIGTKFYSDKVKGVEPNWFSFVAGQNSELLPLNINQQRVKVGVFLSSEFEFAAVSPEWDKKPYSDQNEGISRICKEFENSDYHFFIRAHPHMKNHNNEHLKNLENNVPKNATYISPGSNISSYSLLKQCDVILTFGSTMGIEACYWAKPSIIAGPTFYRSLNVGTFCNVHEEVIEALKGPWKIGDKFEACVFGTLMCTYGFKFKHVQMETPFKGTFKGKNVQIVKKTWRKALLKLAQIWAKIRS